MLQDKVFLPDDFLQVPKEPNKDLETLQREWAEIPQDPRLAILREPPPSPHNCFVCGQPSSDLDGLICYDCWHDDSMMADEEDEGMAYAA